MKPSTKGLDDLFASGQLPRLRRAPKVCRMSGKRLVRPSARVSKASPVSTLEVGDARLRVVNGISEFLRTAKKNEALFVRATPGLGKSRAAGLALQRYGKRALWVLGTKALAQEVGAKFGFTVLAARSTANCRKMPEVEALTGHDYPVESRLCGTRLRPLCEFRINCAYYQQFRQSTRVSVGTTEQMYNPLAVANRSLVVVDDGDLKRAMIERHIVTQSVLRDAVQIISHKENTNAISMLIRVLLRAAERSARDGSLLQGAHAWDLISTVAAEDGYSLVQLIDELATSFRPDKRGVERLRWFGPRILPNHPFAAEDIRRSPSRRVKLLLETLVEEKESFESRLDFNSRLRFLSGRIELAFVRALPKNEEGSGLLDDAAILILDATPIESLVDRLLVDHAQREPLVVSAHLPSSVEVVQFATGGYGITKILQGDEGYRDYIRAAIEHFKVSKRRRALLTYKRLDSSNLGFHTSKVATFGSARGTNALEDVELLVVVGNYMAPLESYLYMAQVLHHEESPVDPSFVLVPRQYGGQPWEIDTLDLADGRASMLLQGDRDEVIQGIYRARPLSVGTDDDPRSQLTIVVITNVPVGDLTIHRLLRPLEDQVSLAQARAEEAERRILDAYWDLRDSGIIPTQSHVVKKAKSSAITVRKYLSAIYFTRNAPLTRQTI